MKSLTKEPEPVQNPYGEFLTAEEHDAYTAWLDAREEEARRVDAEEFDAMYAREAFEAEHAAALEQDAGEGEPW